MFKGLYDNFKHWFHEGKGQVWFYSDPHFADEEMKYLRANYIGDEEQVKRINSKIGKWDTLVILGDIGDTEFVKKLRGYKVLVMGNHDAGASNYKRVVQEKKIKVWSEYEPHFTRKGEYDWEGGYIYHEDIIQPAFDNHLFDEVYEGALTIAEKLILSHEPIDFPYALNIHGHDHSKWHQEDNMHWNMCAEHINYTPICLKHIIESGRLKTIPTIHRETIGKATERKLKRGI